ncbi:MAG: TetR family transcriptional regulator [Solirubrobacterales bacterium]
MSRPETDPRRAQDPLLDRILTDGAPPTDEVSGRILAAAIQQLEDFGVRRFTIDDVARRAGISRVTIYRHFPKKDRLVEAALLHELHRFLRDLNSTIASYDRLEERLLEGFVSALMMIRNHQLLNRLLRTEPELMLPLLTVQASPVLTAGRELIANFARGETGEEGLPLSEEEIDGLSELLARLVLSFLLTPDSVLDLTSPAKTRRFAKHYLAPALDASRRPVRS